MDWEIKDLKDKYVVLTLPVEVEGLYCISVSIRDWKRIAPGHGLRDALTHYDENGNTYIVVVNTQSIDKVEPPMLWHEIAHATESVIIDEYETGWASNEVVADLVGLIKGGHIAHMHYHLCNSLTRPEDNDIEENIDNIVSRVYNVFSYHGIAVSKEKISDFFDAYKCIWEYHYYCSLEGNEEE